MNKVIVVEKEILIAGEENKNKSMEFEISDVTTKLSTIENGNVKFF